MFSSTTWQWRRSSGSFSAIPSLTTYFCDNTSTFSFQWRLRNPSECTLLTYLLTPWSRVLLEKLTGSAASQEIPRILWNPKVHYRTHKCPRQAATYHQNSACIYNLNYRPIPINSIEFTSTIFQRNLFVSLLRYIFHITLYCIAHRSICTFHHLTNTVLSDKPFS